MYWKSQGHNGVLSRASLVFMFALWWSYIWPLFNQVVSLRSKSLFSRETWAHSWSHTHTHTHTHTHITSEMISHNFQKAQNESLNSSNGMRLWNFSVFEVHSISMVLRSVFTRGASWMWSDEHSLHIWEVIHWGSLSRNMTNPFLFSKRQK